MESMGEFFRQVRETKGLTIDEVASKTRIRSDFVKALEDGNFAKLPDQVFARGFVRSYARSLGLDEDDAIHRFTQSAGAYYDKQVERERLKVRQAEEERKRQANRKAVAIAIGIAILTLIFLLSREQSSLLVRRSSSDIPASGSKRAAPTTQESQDAPPSQQAEAAPSAPPAPKTKPSEPADLSAKAGEDNNARPVTGPGSTASVVPELTAPAPSSLGSDGPLGGISLEGTGATEVQLALDLEATELSWVVVQIDGGSPQEALLRPGEKATWKGQDQFILTLGNAGGVKAELNGKPLKPFGPSGKVARDIVIKR
ncbi:MAG: helix-turn-helix domain-containing protein [Nitrospiraceae bacterium]|nr:helix-turn-helix domain-containing protein [Nitrospiraceae bacterium]